MGIPSQTTGNPDPKLSLEIMQLFRRLNDVGDTAVIASHDLSLLNSLDGR